MAWNERLLDAESLGVASGEETPSAFTALVEALFKQQARTWPQLREGMLALNSVEVRALDLNGASVLLQHNPLRIVSTSARVDEKSIRERPCFLCSQNMPPEEKGLAVGDDLIAFCNPFPVLSGHLVVLSREHIPQRIEGHIDQFLALAKLLGSNYVALYNGAKCGASAPDHLHFQAGLAERLTIFDELARHQITSGEPVSVGAIDSYGAGFIWFSAKHVEHAMMTLETIMRVLRYQTATDDEPMVNLLARHEGERWDIVIIPRTKHRPRSYFEEPDKQVLVSPAAIDLAGLVVVPRQLDFERLDTFTVMGIFGEVTFPKQHLEGIIATANGLRGEVRA